MVKLIDLAYRPLAPALKTGNLDCVEGEATNGKH